MGEKDLWKGKRLFAFVQKQSLPNCKLMTEEARKEVGEWEMMHLFFNEQLGRGGKRKIVNECQLYIPPLSDVLHRNERVRRD